MHKLIVCTMLFLYLLVAGCSNEPPKSPKADPKMMSEEEQQKHWKKLFKSDNLNKAKKQKTPPAQPPTF